MFQIYQVWNLSSNTSSQIYKTEWPKSRIHPILNPVYSMQNFNALYQTFHASKPRMKYFVRIKKDSSPIPYISAEHIGHCFISSIVESFLARARSDDVKICWSGCRECLKYHRGNFRSCYSIHCYENALPSLGLQRIRYRLRVILVYALEHPLLSATK